MDRVTTQNVETPPATADVIGIVCSVCEHEVPVSEALVPEATDYVVYLCGLDCYERWSSGASLVLTRSK